jgi:hypothetical protein
VIIALLIVTFIVAFAVASIVVLVFSKPIDGILSRIIPEEIGSAWARYLKFAIYVVGIGGGVRVWSLEKYLTLQDPYNEIVPLTSDRWVLELYDTIIGTLQSTVILLLVFFVFALIALVIVRALELRRVKTELP